MPGTREPTITSGRTLPDVPEHRVPTDAIAVVSRCPWSELPAETMVMGLLDALLDGILLLDDAGRIVLVNTRTTVLFGYDSAQLLGQPIDIVVPSYVPDAGVTSSARRRDGSEFAAEISLTRLAAPEGPWALVTVRDTSDRLEAEQAMLEDALAQEQIRIGEVLGDTVVRGLFGTGLRLQGLLEVVDERARPGLQQAIDSIDVTIREVRRAVFDLPAATLTEL